MKSVFIATFLVLVFVGNALTQNQTTTATISPISSPRETKSPCKLPWLATDIFPTSPRPSTQYSADYKWVCGKYISGGGFAEIGKNRPVISRHNMQFKPFPKHAPWLAIRHEFAFNKSSHALQTGIQVEFTQVPKAKKVVAKVFRSLSVSPMARWSGKVGTFNETQIGWNTKQFKLGPAKVWSEGFERIRGGSRRDFGQWQGWVMFPKLSKHIAFGFEIESTGWKRKHTPLFGIKIFK